MGAMSEKVFEYGCEDAYEGGLEYLFVSYAHKDADRVFPVIAGMQERLLRVWYDPGIQVGTEWDTYILDHLERCSCVVFFMSRASLASAYCEREIRHAREVYGRDVVVVDLDGIGLTGCETTWEGDYGLGSLQHLLATRHAGTETLCDELAEAPILQPCKDTYEVVGNVLVRYLGGSQTIRVPEGVTRIGRHAFMTPNATRIIVPEGVTQIDAQAFVGCGQLRHIVLPQSLEELGEEAFLCCASLEEVELPPKLKRIRMGCFTGCIALRTVVWDPQAYDMEVNALQQRAKFFVEGREISPEIEHVSNAYLPGGKVRVAMSSIEREAFSDCVQLSDFALPESLTGVGEYAFRGCRRLVLELPGSLLMIGARSFRGCKRITVDPRNKYLLVDEAGALFRRISAGEGQEGRTYECADGKDPLRLICGPMRPVETYRLPDNVREVGRDAFSGNSRIRELVLNDGLASVSDSAFANCHSLEQVVIPEGVRFGNAKSIFAGCSSLVEVNLPSSMDAIGERWFEGCRSLQHIELPQSVTTIGRAAFEGCRSLQHVELPHSVTSIGRGAFTYCMSLVEITIPASCRVVGEDAFGNCIALKELTIEDGVQELESGAFFSCASLRKVMLPPSVRAIGNVCFTLCKHLVEVDGPGLEVIGDMCFKECPELAALRIKKAKVKSLGKDLFDDCPLRRFVEKRVAQRAAERASAKSS